MRKLVLLILLMVSSFVNGETPAWKSDCTSKPFLSEVTRYLYRWHMSPKQIMFTVDGNVLEFWVRKLDYKLDPMDKSIYQEIIIPKNGMRVVVKKTDYLIPEMNIKVKSEGYRIVSYNQVNSSHLIGKKKNYKVVDFDYKKLKKHLFETRNDVVFPNPALVKRLGMAVSVQIRKRFAEENKKVPKELEHVVHISSLSPVSNEIWVFWELGGLLFRFSSDVDIEHPAMWQHHTLLADVFDLQTQVIVSLDEIPGSNAYLTRDQAGRILYNCIVRGKAIKIRDDLYK